MGQQKLAQWNLNLKEQIMGPVSNMLLVYVSAFRAVGASLQPNRTQYFADIEPEKSLFFAPSLII